jgi:hypothetical protein
MRVAVALGSTFRIAAIPLMARCLVAGEIFCSAGMAKY